MALRPGRLERTPAPDTRALARIIGRRLRTRREAAGLNRLQFVEHVGLFTAGAGITWAKLQHYEEGRGLPNVATLMKLAAALGLTVCGFLKGIEKDLTRATAAATMPAAGPDAPAPRAVPAARPPARLADVAAG